MSFRAGLVVIALVVTVVAALVVLVATAVGDDVTEWLP